MDRKKNKTIYSQRIAGYLMQRGFVLLKMEQNKYDNTKNVFFFRESPEIEEAIGEYLNKK